MTILVFGQSGQVARELAALAPDLQFLSRSDVDLLQPEEAASAIHSLQPTAVINAAAWTSVDAAEVERDAAFTINAAAPSAMAKAASALNIPFVQISTDYVFDGSGNTPWRPDDPTEPLGVYGTTKLAGEQEVRSARGPHAILRTSWVFSDHGTNFVKTMLRLSQKRKTLTIVADQVGGPTPAQAIASACLEISKQLGLNPNKSGTYHLSGYPYVSWADFARAIFVESGQAVLVEDIASSAYPSHAPRPKNSRLDCASIKDVFGISQPDWRSALAEMLAKQDSGSSIDRRDA